MGFRFGFEKLRKRFHEQCLILGFEMNKATHHDIKRFADEIASQFRPEKIILFGSHATENPSHDSDVDLLVIMDFEGRPHQKAFEIRKRIKRSFPLDLLVRQPADIARRLNQGDLFLNEIMLNGKVLYESADKGMNHTFK